MKIGQVWTRLKDAAQRFYEQPYRQAEALVAVDRLLQPRRPLPRLGTWAIAPDFALLLTETALAESPRTILELGSGASTLLLSYVLEQKGCGRILSIDHDPTFLDETRALLESHGLGSRVQWIHAPLAPTQVQGREHTWYELPPDLPTDIDLLLVDGPPGKLERLSRYPALPLLARHLAPGATVLVDDASRRDEREMVRRWQREQPSITAEHLPLYKGACVLKWSSA